MSALDPASLPRSSSAVVGMVTMTLAVILLPMGDAITKSLTAIMAPAQIAAVRTLVQAGFLVVAYLAMRRRVTGKPFTIWSFASGQFFAIIIFCLIAAFQTMPIATAIAIFFIEPLVLTLLAGVLLGEKPGPHRYTAIGVGMLGVLLILRPNFATFGPVIFLPVVAAVAFALNMIVTRHATNRCSPLTFQLGTAIYAGVTLTAVMLITSDMTNMTTVLSPLILTSLVGAGILSTASFLLITFAFSRTEASLLAPFQYLEIFGATLIGFLVFGDVPDTLTVLGTVLILGSGLYVFHRERRANQRSDRPKTHHDNRGTDTGSAGSPGLTVINRGQAGTRSESRGTAGSKSR